MHLTVAMLGDSEFFSKFGKSGTINDLSIRNQAESGNVVTFVAPNSDRIQGIIQALAMADYPVLIANEITPALGEMIIAIGEAGFDRGLFVTDYYEDKLRALASDYPCAAFDFTKKDEKLVREKILNFKPNHPSDPLIIPIDNYFPVKGVGTVVLGLVKSGQAKQYDKLTIYPTKNEITVKSMQSQDEDVKQTEPGQRIGLALKGVETDELKRGYVISNREMKCAKSLQLDLKKSKYSKFDIAEGKRLFVCIGLQCISGEIKSVYENKITVELDSEIAIYQKRCILASADSMPRIVGHGIFV